MTQQHPNSADIDKWLKLNNAHGIGPITFGKLLKHFGSVDSVLGASVLQLTQVDGIGPKTAEQMAASRDKFNAAFELELADKLGVGIINLNDPAYPPLLRQIYDPPPVLYIKGSIVREDNLSIAIVGCRRCSLYGQEQASRFAHLLGSAGFTICSGMARGVDTAAHRGALSAGGRTIAVQGCGLSHIFPPENRDLFEQIANSGACISELPLKYEPLAENFPSRNRIIAGLSLGTIVVECGPRSGALITASSALDNNRVLMAVPGKVDSPISQGPHRLIKEGAALIESIDDVMEALGCIGRQLKTHAAQSAQQAQQIADTPLFDAAQLNLSENERKIYDCLTKSPSHVDQIIAQADLTPGCINAGLISLQLKGLIKQLPGSFFIKK